jgi:hypothetical protein
VVGCCVWRSNARGGRATTTTTRRRRRDIDETRYSEVSSHALGKKPFFFQRSDEIMMRIR